jgi:hypothetical protein
VTSPSVNAWQSVASLITLAVLAGCQVVPNNASTPAPTPAPAPAPVAQTPEPRKPVSAQSNLNWEVAPVEPGIWSYRTEGGERLAAFGPAGQAPHLVFACSPATRQIALRLPLVSGASRALTIHTTYGALAWSAAAGAGGAGGFSTVRPANDPGFDWIAYSRGRIAVDIDGRSHIIVPSASEIGRVVEDCRS